jgi:hypothetical protein
MRMPKATVNEDCPPIPTIREVRFAGEAVNVLSKPQTVSVDGRTDPNLRYRILRTDSGHYFGTG